MPLREEMGLRLSLGTVEGGVKRLPTLTEAAWFVVVVVAFSPDMGAYFCGICEPNGRGSSKLGRLFAAGLRALKLEDAPVGSRLETIPGCCIVAVARVLKAAARPWSGGLNPSVPSLGGVGKVPSAWAVVAGVEVDAPGQYCALACCCEKSTEGNLYVEAESGAVGSELWRARR